MELVAAVSGSFLGFPSRAEKTGIIMGSVLNHVEPQCGGCVVKTDILCTVREETVCPKPLKSL